MRRSRFTDEQIIGILKEHQARMSAADLCRKHGISDSTFYKWRHLIENFFAKLKEFKRIAMRSDKTDESFEAMIYVCSAIVNSR